MVQGLGELRPYCLEKLYSVSLTPPLASEGGDHSVPELLPWHFTGLGTPWTQFVLTHSPIIGGPGRPKAFQVAALKFKLLLWSHENAMQWNVCQSKMLHSQFFLSPHASRTTRYSFDASCSQQLVELSVKQLKQCSNRLTGLLLLLLWTKLKR